MYVVPIGAKKEKTPRPVLKLDLKRGATRTTVEKSLPGPRTQCKET